jgi:hypothetical protein
LSAATAELHRSDRKAGREAISGPLRFTFVAAAIFAAIARRNSI